MKVINLDEAKNSDDPEFIDRLIDCNSEFRKLLEDRRRRERDLGRVTSLVTVRERLQRPDR